MTRQICKKCGTRIAIEDYHFCFRCATEEMLSDHEKKIQALMKEISVLRESVQHD